MSLAKTIRRNTLFGVAEMGTQMVTRLILVPIVVSHIGLDGYGVWAVLVVVMAQMRFGASGVKSAFQKYVAEALGSRDFDRASRLLTTGAAAILLLSIVGLVPVAMFSEPILRAVGVPEQFIADGAAACIMLALSMIVSNAGGAFESIIMGMQRIDIAKKITVVLLVAEAICITILLHLGFGLFAMMTVLAVSELIRTTLCWRISRRVAPEIALRPRSLDRSVIPELVRFGGTFQLSNMLEILFMTTLTTTVLKLFGAEAAGIFAISRRLVMVGSVFLESLLLPLLSGGAMVHGSGSRDGMRDLFVKASKGALALAMVPLAFIALFGEDLVVAWVNQQHEFLRVGLWCYCLAHFFRSMAMVYFVFYRASGGAAMDIFRQMFRVVILIVFVAQFGRHLSYVNIMAGLVAIELVGMLIILKALRVKIPRVATVPLLANLGKIVICTAIALVGSMLVGQLLQSIPVAPRFLALLQIVAGVATFVAMGIPALRMVRFFSSDELEFLRVPRIVSRARM